MTGTCGILSLSNDVLRDVLDHIDADPSEAVGMDRRAYLSVESFRPPNPPSPSRALLIRNIRLTCRRFADLGAPYQFTRVTTRFSYAGFERLENIASRPHLAKHTKKFSYLIPDFYQTGRDKVKELIDQFPPERFATSRSYLNPSHFKDRAQAQRHIVESGRDRKALVKAMSAFRSLQHVQILRLQDEADRCLSEYIHGNPDRFLPLVDLNWGLACGHALKTVGEALTDSRSSFSRFSGPMMTPDGAMALTETIPQNARFLAERLTCLELHFEGGLELQDCMVELSPYFKHVFTAARNLQALHIGFPSRQPLRIPLEVLFHEIYWEKLRAFGVQAWRLDADEIINFARRHRRTLRGLRLRDVLLLRGNYWRDVLHMLREELETLEWVSLRRIDYSDHFDNMWLGTMEVPDYPPSESDSDDQQSFHRNVDIDDSDWDADSDNQSDIDFDNGPEANEIALSPDTPSSLPFCTCSQNAFPTSALEIGDNGTAVYQQQRKMWEKWVIGRCPEHGHA